MDLLKQAQVNQVGLLFQGDCMEEVYAQILASFGPDVSFVLKEKDLRKTDLLAALRRVQVQMASLYPEKGGYVLVDFSEPMDDALQMVLVYQNDLQRVLELAVEVGIYAAPALDSRLAAEGDGEDG